MKSAAFDSKLGGRDMDWAIAQHAAEEFKAKTGNVSRPGIILFPPLSHLSILSSV